MNSLDSQQKKELLDRLARIEGQVRGVSRMIEEDRYCVDILAQVNAARNALKKVGLKVLDSHIQGCVRTALREREDGQIIEELLRVIEKFTD